jgi:ATP-binding cassette subfamily F protein 3
VGVKDVLAVKDLEIGYEKTLSTVNLDVKRGEKIGIIGGNGLGKSTFIKTIMSKIPAISGTAKFGPRVSIGYFEQQMAQYSSGDTVLADFLNEFPSLTEYEARSSLAAFLFFGEDVFKTVDMLSGGEKVRLALCKILNKRPNFLILDEPTNHMDIIGKEALEEILQNFSGTVIFVSHDRYFIKKISTSLLVFEEGKTELYPFGYEQYIEKQTNEVVEIKKQTQAKEKKTFTTPLKEKARRERELKKCEEKIALLENQINEIELQIEENSSDYVKLSELQALLENYQMQLETEMNNWEILAENV